MGSTFRFLAIGDEAETVVDWFRQQPDPPTPFEQPWGVLLHFWTLGQLVQEPPGFGSDPKIDSRKSPLASVYRPMLRRGVLWTAGEVHFLPTPLRERLPELNDVSQRFGRWLRRFEPVFTGKLPRAGEWDYYLEGSLKNYDSTIFALPLALNALRTGQYFVAESDNADRLDKLCRSLRHRGVQGITEE